MYPKFFRSNPADPLTEIVVNDEAAEASVRETRVYPHEVIKETPADGLQVEKAETAEEIAPKRGPGRPPKADA